MDKTQAAPFRQQLLTQKSELLAQLAAQRGGAIGRAEAAADHFGQPEDPRAQLATERELEFALDERETTRAVRVTIHHDRNLIDPASVPFEQRAQTLLGGTEGEIPDIKLGSHFPVPFVFAHSLRESKGRSVLASSLKSPRNSRTLGIVDAISRKRPRTRREDRL